jgi:hypothetical protein
MRPWLKVLIFKEYAPYALIGDSLAGFFNPFMGGGNNV